MMIFNDWFAIYYIISHNLFSMAGKFFITLYYLTQEAGYHPERQLSIPWSPFSSASSQSFQVLSLLSFLCTKNLIKIF